MKHLIEPLCALVFAVWAIVLVFQLLEASYTPSQYPPSCHKAQAALEKILRGEP